MNIDEYIPEGGWKRFNRKRKIKDKAKETTVVTALLIAYAAVSSFIAFVEEGGLQ